MFYKQICQRPSDQIQVKSSLPVVKHAVHNEQVAAENRADRLTLWMRNVERQYLSLMLVQVTESLYL